MAPAGALAESVRTSGRRGLRVVGDEDADPKVAKTADADADGNVYLEALPGSVSRVDLLTLA